MSIVGRWSIGLIVVTLTVISNASETAYYTRDQISECTSDKVVIERLKENYKSFRQPSASGAYVWIEVWVQEVTSINEILGNFEMEIYITELW